MEDAKIKKMEYSFEQWCLDNNRKDILDRWDYELNNKRKELGIPLFFQLRNIEMEQTY